MIEAHWSEVRAIYQAGIFPENGVSLGAPATPWQNEL